MLLWRRTGIRTTFRALKPRRARKVLGDVIRALKPDLVVQPWTEDPKLGVNATGPVTGDKKRIAALASMQTIAAETMEQTRKTRYFNKDLRDQFYFLGESNINNPDADQNLMTMERRRICIRGE